MNLLRAATLFLHNRSITQNSKDCNRIDDATHLCLHAGDDGFQKLFILSLFNAIVMWVVFTAGCMTRGFQAAAKAYFNQLLVLLFGFGYLLALLLLDSLMLCLLRLLELPGTVQSCRGFAMTSHLLDLPELPNALLVGSVQQLVQTPGRNWKFENKSIFALSYARYQW